MYSLAVTSLTLDAEPACPAGERSDTGPRHAVAAAHRPTGDRRHPSGHLGRTGSPDAVGHAVLRLGLPAGLVGCLRRERPRGDAGRGPGRRATRRRSGRDRAAHAPSRGRARRRPDPYDDASRPRCRTHAGPPDGDGGLLRSLVPRRLRDTARRPGRPDRGRGCPGRVHRRAGRASPVGRGGPPAAPLRRPGCRCTGGGARCARSGRGLDARHRARGRLPGRHAASRLRHGRLSREPRQEGASRDQAQGPSCRGRRRDPPRRLA